MDFSSINWLAVVVCVIVSMVVGTIWYNPKTFYPAWLKGIGKTIDPGKTMNMTTVWSLTILASLVQAVAMAFVVRSIGGLMPGGPNLANGAMVGFMMWLGFVAPTYLTNNLFAGNGFKVWAIEVGDYLVTFLLFGAILGAWH